ncbi:MAG: hypothetical protein IT446_13875 [Phycisphaerales bacterium]|nr:hypothetical protein [Phycisphaerales bacterium]
MANLRLYFSLLLAGRGIKMIKVCTIKRDLMILFCIGCFLVQRFCHGKEIPLSPVAIYDNYQLSIRDRYWKIPVPSGAGVAVEQDAVDPYAMVVFRGLVTLYAPDGRIMRLSDAAMANPYAMPHSGDGRWLARRGDKLWACWMGNEPSLIGTPCWIAQVDLKTWKAEAVRPLGYANPKLTQSGPRDNHAAPQVIIGSNGTLYVILGAHHGPIQWLKSTHPLTILTETKYDAAFWPAKIVGPQPTRPAHGQTYPDLLIDPDDTIHVVSRSTADNYKWQLVHWTIFPDGQTGPVTVIDQAKSDIYAIWYQHLSWDSAGNLKLVSQRHEQATHGAPIVSMESVPVTRISKDEGRTWTIVR